ncbi:MAG TPA: hypothetical protein VKA08_05795, partial [Balneolales bacterium]|nr:hypothetical protein [Balneolales bacterium]
MNRSHFYSFPIFILAISLAAGAAFSPAAKPHKKTSDDQYPVSLYNQLRWRRIGPYRGGRAVVAAGIPSDPYTYY